MVLYTKIECLQRTVIDVGRVDRMIVISVSERHTGIMLYIFYLVSGFLYCWVRGGYTNET